MTTQDQSGNPTPTTTIPSPAETNGHPNGQPPKLTGDERLLADINAVAVEDEAKAKAATDELMRQAREHAEQCSLVVLGDFDLANFLVTGLAAAQCRVSVPRPSAQGVCLAQATADLFAASPDLLRACRYALRYFQEQFPNGLPEHDDDWLPEHGPMAELLAAIAKATGGAL